MSINLIEIVVVCDVCGKEKQIDLVDKQAVAEMGSPIWALIERHFGNVVNTAITCHDCAEKRGEYISWDSGY